MGNKINTSVDELMRLVKKYEKTSFKDAAKELNVPISTIQEWVGVLEEEKLVKVVYSFTKPYIVHQRLSDTDKKARIKRFDQKKDNLSVKLGMTSKFFHDLDAQVGQISTLVHDVEKNMENNLSHISKDLKDLAEAEREKEKIDKEIIDSKQRSLAQIQQLEAHMRKSEDNFEKSYGAVEKEFNNDLSILQKNKTFIEKMRLQEKSLKTKLAECNKLSEKIQSDFEKQNKKVEDASHHIIVLQKQRENLLKQIKGEHVNLAKVIQKSRDYESSIKDIQKQVYDSISQKTRKLETKISDAKKLPQNIRELLDKKNKIKNLILEITHAQVTAKHEVQRLHRESELLRKHVGMKDVDADLQQIHEDIEAMKEHKTFLEDRLKELFGVLTVKK